MYRGIGEPGKVVGAEKCDGKYQIGLERQVMRGPGSTLLYELRKKKFN